MLGAIFLRMPIAIAMAVAGFVGSWIIRGNPTAVLSQMKSMSYDMFSSYSLSIVPMFLLMGQFATKSGMSKALFETASDWLGHRKGGVAMAAVGACAGFGAVCGSSLATASTMGQVALPEMRKRGYSDALSTGVLAAGGTLGILIPPSVILVIYAILTEQNIVKMFLAAFIPGILAALGYMLAERFMSAHPGVTLHGCPILNGLHRLQIWPLWYFPGHGQGTNWSRRRALFTPTKAHGAVATGLYGLWTGGLNRKSFVECILSTASASAMIFLILLGAQLFNSFLAITQMPHALAEWIGTSGFSPMTILLVMLLTYLIFGCVMDSLSMILLTIPIFFPIIESLDFGMTAEATAIWFGILALIVVEVGLITPPVGMNLFIINSMAKDIPMQRTYHGVLPFLITDILRVALLISFPTISLWLVSVMF